MVQASLRLACAAAGLLCLTVRPGVASTPANVDGVVDDVLNRLWVVTDEHWHKGEYNHIINLNRLIVAGQPNRVDAYANSGWLLWSMDRDEEAVSIYELGVKANPDTFFMYDEMGMYYADRKKDWAKALPWYEKAGAFPDCPMATLHMLAHAYEHTGDQDKALKVWERAAAIPGDTVAIRQVERIKAARAKPSDGTK